MVNKMIQEVINAEFQLGDRIFSYETTFINFENKSIKTIIGL